MRPTGRHSVGLVQPTALPNSFASEPTRDWSKALVHWRKICEAKKDDVSECSTNLSTLNALRKQIVKAPDLPKKSEMLAMLEDCRSVASERLTSAQEEHGQAIKAVKAFKAHTVSPKQLMRQNLSMMDAVLLLHTQDPNMTLGELREKILNNAILVCSKTPTVKLTSSDNEPVTKVAKGPSACRSTATKDDARSLQHTTNKLEKTAPHGKSNFFEPPSKHTSTPVIKYKSAPDSLAARRTATTTKTTKVSGSNSQVKKHRHGDDEPSTDEPATRPRLLVAKRSSGQAFEETTGGPRKRESVDSVEKAAVEKKSSENTKPVDTPSLELFEAKLERLNDTELAEVAMSDTSVKATSEKSIKLDEYFAQKKAEKVDATPDVQHSTSATKQKMDNSDETAPVEEQRDAPPVSIKDESPLEAGPDVALALMTFKEDVCADEANKSEQRSTSSGSSSPMEQPAVRKPVGRKGVRKPGDAGVALVKKKDKKTKKVSSVSEAEEKSFIVNDDEPLEVDIDVAARKALEKQGLATDAIMTGTRRTDSGSRSQTDRRRKSAASSFGGKKQKRKRAEDDDDNDDDESTPARKKINRRAAVPRMRHAAPIANTDDRIVRSVSVRPAPSADIDTMDIDSVPALTPAPLRPAASTTYGPWRAVCGSDDEL